MSVAELPDLPVQKTEANAAPGRRAGGAVQIRGDFVHLHEVALRHREAAAILAAAVKEGGEQAALELIGRALPVGLVAVSIGSHAIDTGGLERSLSSFHATVREQSTAAAAAIEAAVQQLSSADARLAGIAAQALGQLPGQLERLMAGEAQSVRDAVAQAVSQVQSAGLNELRAALAEHSRAVHAVLSVEDGPVRTLRGDLLTAVDASRRELAEHMTTIRAQLQAAEAARTATAAQRTTRQAGAEFETAANSLMAGVCAASGDYYTEVGSIPAPGGTRRSGDGLITLASTSTGGAEVKIVVEAKTRTKALTASQWARELASSMQLRGAAAALALVPDAAQLPNGASLFCRVAPNAFVVAADDGGRAARLVFLTMKEVLHLTALAANGGGDINREAVETLIRGALDELTGLDELTRLINSATSALGRALEQGLRVKQGVHGNLTRAVTALNPHQQ
ncbi:MAG: hypothetical protein ACTHQ3_07950 [Motilibacteraceae bacterium]